MLSLFSPSGLLNWHVMCCINTAFLYPFKSQIYIHIFVYLIIVSFIYNINYILNYNVIIYILYMYIYILYIPLYINNLVLVIVQIYIKNFSTESIKYINIVVLLQINDICRVLKSKCRIFLITLNFSLSL